MSNKNAGKFGKGPQQRLKHAAGGHRPVKIEELGGREKYFNVFVAVVLLGFGIYQSVLYFGHKQVPLNDYCGFVETGHEILAFKEPSTYKRAPVLGILQIALSKFLRGPYRELTAGWLLNAILHPVNLLLIWLIGKRIVGKSAMWLAVVAIMNPWVVYLLTEPVAETTLLFFVLLTIYFIFRGSGWSYLFASVTTMVRYEGAALILAAFVMDMINRKTRREKVLAFIYSALASVPLALWLLGTALEWQKEGSTHYLKELGAMSGGKIVLADYIRLLWQVGFGPWFAAIPRLGEGVAGNIVGLGKVIATAGFVFGAIYGLYKRNWTILVLLMFFVPYIVVHSLHSFMYPRFCATVAWLALLMCWFGLQSFWKILNKDSRIPAAIVLIAQALMVIIALAWLVLLVPYLPRIAPASEKSVSLPYVMMGIMAVLFGGWLVFYKARYWLRAAAITMVICAVLVSSHFVLASVVGNGDWDVEFKYLTDWYLKNAKPGEKLVCSMAGLMRIFAPEYRDLLIPVWDIKGENAQEFVEDCYKQDVTYIVWDSRIGFNVNDRYYKLWRMRNIAVLGEPRDFGPYKFLTRIASRSNPNRFVNVFRLERPGGRSEF